MIKIFFLYMFCIILLTNCKTHNKTSYTNQYFDSVEYEQIPIPIFLEHFKDLKIFIRKHHINNNQQIITSYDSLVLDDTTYLYKSVILNVHSLLNPNRKNNSYGSDLVEIVNGYPVDTYKVVYGGVILKSISYKKHNYSGFLKVYDLEGNLLYQSRFKEGSGYWKDYYHKEAVLKEEGEVKKNYKYGKWTYYSKTGEIDSTKHYTLKDSVDVRYPYCFFNKTEPCY